MHNERSQKAKAKRDDAKIFIQVKKTKRWRINDDFYITLNNINFFRKLFLSLFLPLNLRSYLREQAILIKCLRLIQRRIYRQK